MSHSPKVDLYGLSRIRIAGKTCSFLKKIDDAVYKTTHAENTFLGEDPDIIFDAFNYIDFGDQYLRFNMLVTHLRR